MANYTTGAQRRNNRHDAIMESYKKHEAAKNKAFEELLKLVAPSGMISFVTEKLKNLPTT